MNPKAAAVVVLILALLLWGPLSSPAKAQGQTTSGSFDITVVNPSGSSVYTIQYSYPSEMVVGGSFNITVVLQIRSLTGLKLFVSAYNITALVGANAGGFIATKTVGYFPASTDLGAAGNLYPGGHWGPVNITLPIGSTPPSPGPGQTAEGFLSIGLLTKVSTYEAIGAPAVTESGSKVVGPLSVVNNSNPSTSIPIEWIVAALAVPAAAIAYLAYSRRRKSRALVQPTSG